MENHGTSEFGLNVGDSDRNRNVLRTVTYSSLLKVKANNNILFNLIIIIMNSNCEIYFSEVR